MAVHAVDGHLQVVARRGAAKEVELLLAAGEKEFDAHIDIGDGALVGRELGGKDAVAEAGRSCVEYCGRGRGRGR